MKKFNFLIIVLLTVFMSFNIVLAVDEPGGENDPLVTQSYIEMQISQLKTYIDEQISTLKNSGSGSLAFEPVTIKPGQKLIGGAGTEMILRVGAAKAIANSEGGIVDTTGGLDIADGKAIPKQHLLIIPRNDGRGILGTGSVDTILMVKGAYKIQ